MLFEFTRLTFEITAPEVIFFPPGKAANKLRGALGMVLPQSLFRSVAAKGGPSGLRDSPRPYVFRARHLEGRKIPAGNNYTFDLHVFAENVQPYVDVFGGAVQREKVVINLVPELSPVPKLRIDFLSPTELKPEGIDFKIVFGRARDRISSLRSLYGAGPLELDFRGMGLRAAAVRLTKSELRSVAVARRSSRSGQTHSIGGFIGTAEYEGDLTEFVPFLEAAQWTGIGRHAVWGNGEIRISAA